MSQKNKLLIPLLIATMFFMWLVWDNYVSSQEPPLIKASSEARRIKPDIILDEIDQPNANIYDNLKNPTASTKSVHLAPEPEEPIKIVKSSENINTEDPISNIISGIIDHDVPISETKSEVSPENALNVVTVTDESSERQFKKRIKTAYYLHLISTSSRESAEKQWVRISKNNVKLTSGLEHKVMQSTTKNRGIFYELLAGPISEHSRAKLLCKKFVQAKQNCIIKKI
jgi:hypothetical protein